MKQSHSLLSVPLLLLAALVSSSLHAQQPIGFVEKFALATDREAAMKELIPGTDAYYFYHALHLQNTAHHAELETLLAQWAKREPDSPLLREIRNREALLTYDTTPQATLEYLKRALNVSFNHQQDTLHPKPNLPTALDNALISPSVFQEQALRDPFSLDSSRVTDAGIDELLASNAQLSPQQRRVLLSRVARPDAPHLMEVILADLERKDSRGFGEFPIEQKLLAVQFEQLAKARPELMKSAAFVLAWAARLRPDADTDVDRDAKAREVWLDALWAFAKDLAPSFNSLKAHVLYQRLVHDEKLGVPNEARFLEYLKLPRSVGYMNPQYRETNADFFRHSASLSQDFGAITSAPPVGDDQSLVRRYLLHFLKDVPGKEPVANAYALYIEASYLKRVLAEAKLLGGVGDAEIWFSMLSPSEVQALRERVDIEFDPANPDTFAPDATVSLDLEIKNVPHLAVNLFEINTENFHRTHQEQIGTDLDLDGLVANKQLGFDYVEAPILRTKRTFKLTDLPARRGVWIVDFIGNGRSSRALIRKGQLHFLTRPSSAGTALTVLDEGRTIVPQAYALLGGQRFEGGKTGEIIIPFSNAAGVQPVILGDGTGFTQLESITLQGENYALTTGFHVPRESLLSGKKATIGVRPTLSMNGSPVDLALLEEVKLSITATNLDGVATSIVKPEFKLLSDKESTVEISVPERLVTLAFKLEGKVKHLITGEKTPLQTEGAFALNQRDSTGATSDLFLSSLGPDFFLQELGRTGEPRSERAVNVSLWRAEFAQPVELQLKTDANGAVLLGRLDGIDRIAASGAGGEHQAWRLPADRATSMGNIHIAAGQDVLLPWLDGDAKPTPPLVSLLETRQGLYVRSLNDDKHVSVEAGYLVLSNLEPGDYSLCYGPDHREANIRVTDGKEIAGWIVGSARHLQARPSVPLQIGAVSTNQDTLTIILGNVAPDTRVHVEASRFLPSFDVFDHLGHAPRLEPLIGTPGRQETLFVSGRTLGEEYRYVMERHGAKKYPGVMLPRPGLLLNPWALQTTETALGEAQLGDEFRRAAGGGRAVMAAPTTPPSSSADRSALGAYAFNGAGEISDVDFLATPGYTARNLTPDKEGKVTLKLTDLGDRQFVRILAMNGGSSVVRDLSLADAKTKIRDLTLRNGLEPTGHFTRQNQVTVLEKDAPFILKDASTAQFEVQGHLGSVFDLLRTLSNSSTLPEFSFILDWPKLDAAKKRELYSQYASHELSFFLQRKDPAFFREVILPYLAGKRDKTFMDHYLVGDDLHAFLRPWTYQRLNVVERILLAQRHPEEAAATAREMTEMNVLLPPNVEQSIRLFDTALNGRGLESDEAGSGIHQKMSPVAAAPPEDAPAKPPMLAMPAPAPEPAKEAEGAQRHLQSAHSYRNLGDHDNANKNAQDVLRNDKYNTAARRSMERVDEEKARYFEAARDHQQAKMLNAVNKGWEDQVPVKFDTEARKAAAEQQLYRKQDPTSEWAEDNYYHLTIDQQLADLVTINGFWKDYAAWDGKGGFLSPHVAEACRSFTEIMLALAVLDLPFPSQAKEPQADVKDLSLTITPAQRSIFFHRELKPAEMDQAAPRLLVSQNFYREGDRYIMQDGEKLDKFVADEFLTGVVYGCQIVVTNPTSSTQKLDLLLQIPQGTIPVLGSKSTDNRPLELESYRTFTTDYYFYFPRAGKFAHHPVHVSQAEKIVAFAPPFTFNVVNELTKLDTGSWDYVSQFGQPADVLTFLEQHNLHQLNLDRMAWRLREPAFYKSAVALLARHHIYHSTTWSYSLLHNDPDALREYLQHADSFIVNCGPALSCRLLTVDPVARQTYQYLEYSPLVNARAHQLGAQRTLLNENFHAQYNSLLTILAHRPALDDEDRLAVAYYLFLQDRIEEALSTFAAVDVTKITEHLQYDYLKAVAALYQGDTATARQLAQAHLQHPVDRWKDRFTEVLSQLSEVEGKKPDAVKPDNREQVQNRLASTEPTLDFAVENKEVKLTYHNVKDITVNYYPMDLEFLFSTAPFVGQNSSRFGLIQPNRTEHIQLPADRETHTFALPRDYHSSNVLVEVVAAGKTLSHAYYSNELNVQVSESYGRLQVLHAKDNRPLPTTYVKVFAEINGQSKFYKDGYTDLRGKFDYLSLSTGEIDQATRFSILVLSDEFGAAVREVKPPQQ